MVLKLWPRLNIANISPLICIGNAGFIGDYQIYEADIQGIRQKCCKGNPCDFGEILANDKCFKLRMNFTVVIASPEMMGYDCKS